MFLNSYATAAKMQKAKLAQVTQGQIVSRKKHVKVAPNTGANMDEFILFGILVLLVVFGLPVYLLIALSRLKDRVNALEASLLTQTQKPATIQPTVAPEIPDETPVEQPPAPKPASAWQPCPQS